MRIRTLFIICMSGLALATGGLGLRLLGEAVSQYRLAGRTASAVEVSSALLSLMEKFSAERVMLVDSLLNEAPATEATRAKIATAGQALDDLLTRTEQMIAGATYPDAPQQVAILHKARAALAKWRPKVAELNARPKDQREASSVPSLIGELAVTLEELDGALDIGDGGATRQDGLVLDLTELARRSWQLRGQTSGRTGPVLGVMSAGKPMSPTLLESLSGVNATINQTWATIDSIIHRLAGVADLAPGPSRRLKLWP